MEASSQDASFDAPMTNGYVLSDFIYPSHQQGRSFSTLPERVALLPHTFSNSADSFHSDHIPTSDSMEEEETVIHDAPAFSQPPAVTETTIDTKVAAPPQADPNAAGPTPVDDVVGGIQPVSDFIPKDASNLSHPTPPPDEPLGTGEADVDMDVIAADVSEPAKAPSPSLAATEPPSVPSLPQSESSLVRAREDDQDEQPAPKRSKIDGDVPEVFDAPVVPSADASMTDQPMDETAEQAEALMSEATATLSGVEVPASVVEPVVEETTAVQPTEDSVVEPSSMDVEASRTQADTQDATPADVLPETDLEPKAEAAEATPQASAEVVTQLDVEHSHTPAEAMDVSDPAATITASPTEDVPAAPAPTTETQPTSEATSEDAKPKYSIAPMTSLQKRALVDKMKNLKKTKSSTAFIRPVDAVAMNIPHYTQVVKNPMDLSTMETKLKQDEYGSVQGFIDSVRA